MYFWYALAIDQKRAISTKDTAPSFRNNRIRFLLLLATPDPRQTRCTYRTEEAFWPAWDQLRRTGSGRLDLLRGRHTKVLVIEDHEHGIAELVICPHL